MTLSHADPQEGRNLFAKVVRGLAGAILLAGCLIYMAVTFDWANIRVGLGTAGLWRVMIILPLPILCFWLVRAWRWQLLLRNLALDPRFREVYYCTVVATSIANYSPFQAGEALKIEVLRQSNKMNRAEGYAIFFVERLMDAAVLLGMAAVALGSFWGVLIKHHGLLYVGLATSACVVAMLLLRQRLAAGRVGEFLAAGWASLGQGSAAFGPPALTLLSWGLVGWMWRLCIQAAGVQVSWLQALRLVSLSTLSSLVSLIPGGLGIVEIINSKLLVAMGNRAAQAQSAALAIRVIGIEMLLLALLHVVVNKIGRGHGRGVSPLLLSAGAPIPKIRLSSGQNG